MVCPGCAETFPVGRKAFSTVLSLNATLVRASGLVNGYWIAHGATTLALAWHCPVVLAAPLTVQVTWLTVGPQICVVLVTVVLAPEARSGIVPISPSLSSVHLMFVAVPPPVLVRE